MADPAMRTAIAYSINRATLNTQILGGTVVPTESEILPTEWFASPPAARGFDLAKARTILKASRLGLRQCPRQALPRLQRRQAQGRQGLRRGHPGLHDDQPGPHCHAQPDRPVAEAARHRTEGEGGRRQGASSSHGGATPRRSPPATSRAATSTSRNSPIFRPRMTCRGSTTRTASSQIPSQVSPDGGNVGRVKSPAIDAAISTATTSMDADQVFAAMKTFQQTYRDKTVAIPLYFRQEALLADPMLRNVTGNANGDVWNVQHWWFAP